LVLLLRGKPVAPLLKVPLRSTDRGILLGVSGICSNLFQRVAIMFISVSFTHTVKASQPLFSGQTRAKLCLCGPDSILSRSLDAFFFSLLHISATIAVLSWVLLGQRFSRASIASLFVISAGVALSALTEFQFHPLGFLAASFSAFR
jgi:drug/metabolite transporter (DMT)-like permease